MYRGNYMKSSEKNIAAEKENGQVYTPLFIVNSVLDISGYSGPAILKKHVIDNSCGDGAFLCEIVERYCKEALLSGFSLSEIARDLSLYIHGIEISKEECDKCKRNLDQTVFSLGIAGVEWDIVCGDALVIRRFDGKMDYVLGNPPYVRVHNLGAYMEEVKKFSFAGEGMTDLFIVFYEIGLKMLKEHGILGYITPNSFFSSLAGAYMRKVFVSEKLLAKVVDLKHFQAFSSTTYTAIVVLEKNRETSELDYYQFDEKQLVPYYVEKLLPTEYYISGNYYFSKKEKLEIIREIYNNKNKCDISVKNGYATLCDSVFISDFDFDSPYIIPVIKASTGERKKIFYPYDKNSRLIPELELKKDKHIYVYLKENKERLLKRSNERDSDKYWYAFGRSQALNDTYKNKLAINSLIRNETDFKFVKAPSGVGVYGGLYIVSETIPIDDIKNALRSEEFMSFVSLIGKYKSGGYYSYSSKDVKAYLDYKFACDGG